MNFNECVDRLISIGKEQVVKIKEHEKKWQNNCGHNWNIEHNLYSDLDAYRILCNMFKEVFNFDDECISWHIDVFLEFYDSPASSYYEFPYCIKRQIEYLENNKESKKCFLELVSVLLVWTR